MGWVVLGVPDQTLRAAAEVVSGHSAAHNSQGAVHSQEYWPRVSVSDKRRPHGRPSEARRAAMRRTAILLSVLLVLACPSPAPAGPKEDVAVATQAWIDAVNSRDPERVVVLYDPEAVLWGTVSPTIRDSPSAIRDYFQTLRTSPPEY